MEGFLTTLVHMVDVHVDSKLQLPNIKAPYVRTHALNIYGDSLDSTTPFMAFSGHMHDSVTKPILRCMLGYTNDQRLHYHCHLMTLGIQVCLLISWHE